MVRGIKYCPTLTRFFLTVNYPCLRIMYNKNKLIQN